MGDKPKRASEYKGEQVVGRYVGTYAHLGIAFEFALEGML